MAAFRNIAIAVRVRVPQDVLDRLPLADDGPAQLLTDAFRFAEFFGNTKQSHAVAEHIEIDIGGFQGRFGKFPPCLGFIAGAKFIPPAGVVTGEL